jgi:hypothetical protein
MDRSDHSRSVTLDQQTPAREQPGGCMQSCDPAKSTFLVEFAIEPTLPVSAGELDAIELLLGADLDTFTR